MALHLLLPSPPASWLRRSDQEAVVGARDAADRLLAVPGSLGVLGRALDRVAALGLDVSPKAPASLLLAFGRHRVACLGVSAYPQSAGEDVAAAARAYDGPAISEDEHEVVLHEDPPVVEKEAVPVERVRLDTERETEQQTVSGEVRKERIDLDDDTVTGRDDTTR